MHMNNSTEAKKQTRVLILSLAVIAVFATVMILITSLGGNRPGGEKPPVTLNSAGETTKPASPKETALPRPDVTSETTLKTETTAAESTDALTPADGDTATVNAKEDALPDFISPITGVIAKGYSTEVPVYSLTMDDYRTHCGIDVAAELGAPVRAAAEGTVTEVWEDPMMGKCIRITHPGGAVSIYKNLAPELPTEITTGAAVQAGAVIGSVGESALVELAEAPHLHYELLIDGVPADPADFMLIGTEDTAYEG